MNKANHLALLIADVFEAAGALRLHGDQMAAAVGQSQARWQVLSVLSEGDWTVASAARRLGASALSVALQGTNLGLHTNYRGKDPDVNAYTTGNGVVDTGVLPQPRTWRLTLTARY